MAEITVSEYVIKDVQEAGNYEFRLYNATPFHNSDGVLIPADEKGGRFSYRKIACVYNSVAKTITVPEIVIDSTTDSTDNQGARYAVAGIYKSGSLIKSILTDFPVPHDLGTPLTWLMIQINQYAKRVFLDHGYYNKNQINALINEILRRFGLAVGNEIPWEVTLISPAAGLTVDGFYNFEVTVTDNGTLNTVTQIEYFVGNVSVGSTASSLNNYRVVGFLNGFADGIYPVFARLTDSEGDFYDSPIIYIAIDNDPTVYQPYHQTLQDLSFVARTANNLLKFGADGTLEGITPAALKAFLLLNLVNNTSDADKPISSAAATALALKADLVGGKVPALQLPSYVDDVLEFDTLGDFPATGEAGKIYVNKLDNLSYRWTGTVYTLIPEGAVLPEGDLNAAINQLDSVQGIALYARNRDATIREAFDGETINALIWASYGTNANNLLVLNDEELQGVTNGANGNDVYGIRSLNPYDLTNKQFTIKIVNSITESGAGNTANGGEAIVLFDTGNTIKAYIYLNNGNLQMYRAGLTTDGIQVPFDSSDLPVWLRLAYDGTNMLWQTSTDGVVFQTHRAVPPTFDCTQLKVGVQFNSRSGVAFTASIDDAVLDSYKPADNSSLVYVLARDRFELKTPAEQAAYLASYVANLGASWTFGTGEPNDAVGVNGDIYFETDAQQIYQRVAGVYELAHTFNFTSQTWRFGTAEPDNAVGIDGDIYFETDAQEIYQRQAGAYVLLHTFSSGGGALPDWLATHPDAPPAVPSAFDDEFNDNTVDPKWTSYGSSHSVTESNGSLLLFPLDMDLSHRGIRQTLDSETKTITAKITLRGQPTTSWYGGGIEFQRTSNSSWYGLQITVDNTGTFKITNNDFVGFNSLNGGSISLPLGVYSLYLRLQNTGTNLISSISFDGRHYFQLDNDPKGSYFGGGTPDRIGIYCFGNVANSGISVDWFRVT